MRLYSRSEFPLIALQMSFFFLLVLISGCTLNQTIKPEDAFDQAVKVIEENYIDEIGNPIRLNTDRRPDIISLLAQLDSAANFLTTKEAEVFSNPSRAGIGVVLEKKDGANYVKSSFEGMPANASGVNPGDRLLEIDNEPVSALPLMNVLARLYGTRGSELTLKVVNFSNEEREIKITRQVVTRGPAVFHKYFKEKGIGYIRISGFAHETSDRVKTSIKSLRKGGMRGLIIDLRGNDGGLFMEVIETTQILLPDGALISEIKGAASEKNKKFHSRGWSHFTDFPIVLLVDRNTLSGAELMAAALRDYKRAALMGETTLGAGAIITRFPLDDGSLLSFRTHLMLTPEGVSIDKNGLKPDLEIKTPKTPEGVYDKFYENIQVSLDDENVDEDSMDTQLEAAIAHFSVK